MACLDACVLIPFGLCDALLTIAETGIYRPVWSDTIIEEVRRNAPDVSRGITLADIDDRIAAMDGAFIGARFSRTDVVLSLSLVPPEVDAKDRHVVATAIAGRADTIVTENTKDFSVRKVFDQLKITVQRAQPFLVSQFEVDPIVAARGVGKQIAMKRRPPITTPRYIDAVRQRFPRYAALLEEFEDEIERARRRASP